MDLFLVDLGWWAALALVSELLAVALAGMHILLNKRNTSSALLWLVVVIFLPLVGTLIYVAFGVDRHGRRATAKELQNLVAREQLNEVGPILRASALLHGDSPDDSPDDPPEADRFPDGLDPFAMLLARLGRYRAVDGCRVEVLDGGQAFYDAAVEAIEGAKSSVVLETYIFDSDAVGQRVLTALSEAAARGVRCSLLYDAIGSPKISGGALGMARAAGVEVQAFDMRSVLRGRFQINLRNHRKMIIADRARHVRLQPIASRPRKVIAPSPKKSRASAFKACDPDRNPPNISITP